MLVFLKENAQWLCAVGMLIFAGIQVWLMYSQIHQQLRLRRLDLANKLGAILADFDTNTDSMKQMTSFIYTNYTDFICLLNKKDGIVFKEFILSFKEMLKESDEDKYILRNKCMEKGLCLLETLGDAKYGITKTVAKNKDITPKNK